MIRTSHCPVGLRLNPHFLRGDALREMTERVHRELPKGAKEIRYGTDTPNYLKDLVPCVRIPRTGMRAWHGDIERVWRSFLNEYEAGQPNSLPKLERYIFINLGSTALLKVEKGNKLFKYILYPGSLVDVTGASLLEDASKIISAGKRYTIMFKE